MSLGARLAFPQSTHDCLFHQKRSDGRPGCQVSTLRHPLYDSQVCLLCRVPVNVCVGSGGREWQWDTWGRQSREPGPWEACDIQARWHIVTPRQNKTCHLCPLLCHLVGSRSTSLGLICLPWHGRGGASPLTRATWPKSWASEQPPPKPQGPGLGWGALTEGAQPQRRRRQLGWPVWALMFRKGGSYEGVRSLFCSSHGGHLH